MEELPKPEVIRLGDDIHAWIEQGSSIHLKAVTLHGDPVELNATETSAVASMLRELATRLDPVDHLDRAKRYHEAIHHVLLREWDPIGTADIPEAQDEYDGYIHEIHGMLIRHEPQHRLVDHLRWIETEQMGLIGSLSRTEAIANRLIGLREEIEAGS